MAVVTMPLETAKNRMAFQKPDPVTGVYPLPLYYLFTLPYFFTFLIMSYFYHYFIFIIILFLSLFLSLFYFYHLFFHHLFFHHYFILGQLPYRGLTQTMTTIAGKEGVKGLFQGFSPYYLRCGGQTLLMFLSVEWLRKTYQSIK